MTNAELLAKIKAEIEVIKKTDGVCQNNNETADIYYARGARFACEVMLSFLDTLESEKTISPWRKIHTYTEEIHEGDMEKMLLELSVGKGEKRTKIALPDRIIDILESEKPIEGLEEEINRYLEPIHTADIQFEPFTQMTKCARHFAQWGAEHSGSSEIPNDLKEAAEKFARFYDQGTCDGIAQDCFIAGAKWQAEKDARDMYMSDNRHFEKVYQLGRTDMREQMMKEAVEGTVMDFSSNQPRPQVDVLLDAHKYHTGDKVRIIIVKEDEK